MYLGFKDKKEFESAVGQKFIDNNLLLIPLSEDFIISNQNSDNDAFSVLHVDCHYIGKTTSFLSGEFDIICIDKIRSKVLAHLLTNDRRFVRISNLAKTFL